MIIAVDFDKTLCKENGEPDIELVKWCKEKRRKGDKLILWTCRGGERLQEALRWCDEQGLVFDAVNDDVEEVKCGYFRDKSCKVYADIYIDDKAYTWWSDGEDGWVL